MPDVQQPSPIYINRFITGLNTNRSPLITPFSTVGLSMITRTDALIDGLNIELTPQMTLARRPGTLLFFPSGLSAGEVVRNGVSLPGKVFADGVQRVAFDLTDAVKAFVDGSPTVTNIHLSLTGAMTTFQPVNDILYYANGTISRKWRGASPALDSQIGIAAPVVNVGLAFGVGTLSFTSGVQYAYSFKSSISGHISTASPLSANTGIQTNVDVTLSGGGTSSDPQVDKIIIWRTKDGGSTLFFDAEINHTPGWSYVDSTADANLDTNLTAPIANENDPPPTGITNLVMHMGRLWGSVGNLVYFAGGPDTTAGVPEEAWPPGNVFAFPYQVVRLLSTQSGLMVFTTSAIYYIRGSDLLSFYPQKVMDNFGIQNYNAVAMDSDSVYIFTSTRQLWAISSTSIEEIGFSIADVLNTFDPATTVITPHRAGHDAGLYVSNGVDTIMRYDLPNAAWSPKAAMTAGVGYIGSQEVSPGTYELLIASATPGGIIQKRDLNTFSDNGTAYAAFVTLGSLVLAPPGSKITLDSILLERMPVGSAISVGILSDEISGSFVDLGSGVNEPPELAASTSVIALRHYLNASATPLSGILRHCQLKFTFATEAAKNEILGIALAPTV